MTAVRDRVVLITGAGSGLGNAYARRFREDGARVVGCDLAANLEACTDACELALECDVTDAPAVGTVVGEVVDRLGSLDVLVANAGIGRRGKIDEVAWGDIEDVVRVNLFGVLHCLRAAIPVMKRQGSGRIVVVASRDAEICPPGLVGYNASKAAVAAATRTLAHELGDADILVNNLIPGPSKTALNPRGQREPESSYPTVKLLATLPAGGPNGRTFFDEAEYPLFKLFVDGFKPRG